MHLNCFNGTGVQLITVDDRPLRYCEVKGECLNKCAIFIV